jgi:hypothetical protein
MRFGLLKNLSKLVLASLLFITFGCKDDDPGVEGPTEAELEVIEGDITSNLTLDASKQYLLRGKVYVQSPNTITIPAGTIIYGEKNTDGTLIINRGAKIEAQGTADRPIVFTSEAPVGFRNRGDWGGIVILGNAQTNGNINSTIEGITATASSENGIYGPGTGIQNTQSSGTMKFVRIEFAGIDLSQDNELNSLTMGSVGSGTVMENIMISYANDDAFEWFGGTNNMKYLVTYGTLDDDFDSDRGYAGNVQYGLVIRIPNAADISTSRAFEASSNNDANAALQSAPKFANITVLGPRMYSTTNTSNLYGAAVEINSNSNIEVHNSIITGFPIGARFNTAGAAGKVVNSIFAENAAITAVSGGSAVPADFLTSNVTAATKEEIFGSTAFDVNTPAPVFQAATSPYLTGAPSLAAAGFEAQPFYGAFGANALAGWNWSTAWIEWKPNEKVYKD